MARVQLRGTNVLTSILRRAGILLAVFMLSLQSLVTMSPMIANAVAPSSSEVAVPFTSSELAANWSADRSTPSGGYTSTSFAERSDVLKMSVDNTNANTSSTFYQTEGLRRSIPASETLRADLYVDSTWSGKQIRAGLWGVGQDSANDVSAYPIVEYYNSGWRIYDSMTGDWSNPINPVSNSVNTWHSLELALNESQQTFGVFIDGVFAGTSPADTTTHLGEVILNSYNYATNNHSGDYDVYWSNLSYGNFLSSAPSEVYVDGNYNGPFDDGHIYGYDAFNNIRDALDAVAVSGTINVTSNLTLTQQLTVDKALAINGNGHTITGSFVKTDNSNNSVVGVQSDDVNISNLTVDGVNGDTNKLHGINVYESDNVSLSNVTAVNGRSGVVVGQGSTVAIDGIQTSGNVWHGINVDKPGAHLTISGTNSHTEARPIFVDDKTVGVVVDADSQYSIFDDGTSYTYVLTSEVEDQDGDVTLPVSGGEATTPINHSTTLSLGNTTVVIPAGTKVTAEGNNPAWDGVISAPTAVTTGVNLPSGTTLGLGIEVGSSNIKLTFGKAVKLVFTDQAGKLVGWQQGSGSFTPITTNCSAYLPNLDNMPAGGDCKTTDNSDLIVWTKHFTTFATYTTKKTTGGTKKSPSLVTTSGSTFTPTTVFAESFGTTSNNGTKSSNGIKDNGDVLGTKTTNPKKNTASVSGKDNSSLIFGLAWYWWVVILAAIGAAWWLVSAWRNRRDTL